MKTNYRIILSAFMVAALAFPSLAQEVKKDVTVTKIKIEKNGEVIEKTYSSKEEMEKDPDLKNFMDKHGMEMSTEGIIHMEGEDHTSFTIDSDDREIKVIKLSSSGDHHMEHRVITHDQHIVMSNDEDGNVQVYRYSSDEPLTDSLVEILEDKNVVVIVPPVPETPGVKPGTPPVVSRPASPEHEEMLTELEYFPNPAKNKLRLKFNANAVPTQITLTDLNGKEIYREELPGFNGTYDNTLNLRKIKDNTVILKISQKGMVRSEKIIME